LKPGISKPYWVLAADAVVEVETGWGGTTTTDPDLYVKNRTWRSRETQRELEVQLLRKLVEQMKDLLAAELAELGRSFNSDNFEMDKPMPAALRRLMKGD